MWIFTCPTTVSITAKFKAAKNAVKKTPTSGKYLPKCRAAYSTEKSCRTSIRDQPQKWIEQSPFWNLMVQDDDNTPACIRASQGVCSRPIANTEFFKHMIEIPPGLNRLIARGIGRIEGGQACYISAVHPLKSKAVFDHNSCKPPIRALSWSQVAYRHNWWNWSGESTKRCVWRSNTHSFIILGKFQVYVFQELLDTMKRKIIRSRIARTPQLKKISGAPGDWLLQPDQTQERLDLIRNCVNSNLQVLLRKDLEEEQLQNIK